MADKDFKPVVFVDKFTEGVLDPNEEMEYFVQDGGYMWQIRLLAVGVPC